MTRLLIGYDGSAAARAAIDSAAALFPGAEASRLVPGIVNVRSDLSWSENN